MLPAFAPSCAGEFACLAAFFRALQGDMCRIPYRSFSQYEEDPYFALASVLCSIAQGAQPDFTPLTHHWNFDEGRDWHNMPFPYANSPSAAQLLLGWTFFLLLRIFGAGFRPEQGDVNDEHCGEYGADSIHKRTQKTPARDERHRKHHQRN